ncbi:hypothetical protein BJF93_14610 [Xaviernesmea oryzae]|uniref:L,D-TPase catalytic domain-containing protein n=1 Tax=Xaviernesmea oryzae TaxID=464029 RepID=A0A1Q9AYD1_9HYPH|nr:L,D-transpeptidase family protein [Xaviernesmea oryzae]OLP60457.1 hypothetical protein BJF93_14610 [Xaviernesmea oryzae]
MKAGIVTVRPAPSAPTRALLRFGPVTVPAAIGRSGRRVLKREGDGATPIASMRVLSGFLRRDRISSPPSRLRLAPIRKDMLWCDAPGHAAYNRLVRAPFKPSHEMLMRADNLYDLCLVLDWNIAERRRNRGSAIFLHLIRPGYQPTEGCIALEPLHMRRLLAFLRPGTLVKVL